jgi:hypothetical protein
MTHDDRLTSDTMRALAKLLPPDDPNHPRNLARAAAAAEASKAAEAEAAPPVPEQIQKLEQVEQLVEAIDPSLARKRRKRRARRRVSRAPQNESALERHLRLCTVCNHDDREDIEDDFLNWLPAEDIADNYDLDYQAVYRHARATGLSDQRENNLRSALGLIVERASTARITGGNVLRAIRAYSCLDRTGRWTDPPMHVVVSSGSELAQPKPAGRSRAQTIEVLPPAEEPATSAAERARKGPSEG